MQVGRWLISLGAGAVCTVLVLGGVIAMNRPVPPPPPPKKAKEVSFQIEAKAKPPPPPTPPPPRRQAPKRPAPPSALLGASLSGLSFGLDAFEQFAVDGSSAAGGSADDVVMTESTVDDPPKAVSRSAPEYPARARAKAVEGYVTLSVLIGEDGVVRDVQVLEAEPPGVFDEAARGSVRGWRFQPAMYKGRAVSVRVQQTLQFSLE